MNQDTRDSLSVSIGKFEIGMGTLVFVYASMSPMIGRLLPLLEPDILYGLWPVMLLLLGPILVLGGASLLKSWRWPLLAHLPLAAWIAFTVFAFQQA